MGSCTGRIRCKIFTAALSCSQYEEGTAAVNARWWNFPARGKTVVCIFRRLRVTSMVTAGVGCPRIVGVTAAIVSGVRAVASSGLRVVVGQ